jgi:Fic family protein
MNRVNIFQMEPLLPPAGDGALSDRVLDLVHSSAALAAPLTPAVREEIGRLVRSMNCYYSNFIEGHQTHPRAIEKALQSNFEGNDRQRALQHEAVAHIAVQKAIDGGLSAPTAWPTSEEYVRWLHRTFCEQLPESLLRVKAEDSDRVLPVIPGEYREDAVHVGHHVPPAPSALATFMGRFEEGYRPQSHSKAQQILTAAAAHHRLLWIHPFLDGNGRVARLMSHAILLRLGVGSSLWSVSRGLARSVDRYKAVLTHADAPRRNDLDGRGALSLEGLRLFCQFFLDVCLDQVQFMRDLLQPTEIVRRIEFYVQDEVAARRLPKGSFEMLREAFYQGEVARGRAPEITGYEERRARETVSALLEKGLLLSKGPRAPVSLGFPIFVLERWLPALYPVDAPQVTERAASSGL